MRVSVTTLTTWEWGLLAGLAMWGIPAWQSPGMDKCATEKAEGLDRAVTARHQLRCSAVRERARPGVAA